MHGARRHFVWDAVLEHLLLQDFRQVHMLVCGLLCCLFITLWFACVSHCVACMSLWFVVCHSVLCVCHFVLSVYITVVVCVSLCVVCVHHCGCVCVCRSQAWEQQLHDAVLSLCQYQDGTATRVFAGLADGTVAVLEVRVFARLADGTVLRVFARLADGMVAVLEVGVLPVWLMARWLCWR